MVKPARIGIFGGSFDPPHIGHRLVVQDAFEALQLDRVIVIPAGTQPLKGGVRTAPHHRLAMVRLCFADMPGIEVDSVEVDRGGVSYMVDTVETLQGRWPSAQLSLLVGEDVVATLPQWRDAQRLLTMVRLVVLRRGEPSEQVTAMLAAWESDKAVLPISALATRRVDVTSTEIRKRLAEGKPVKGFIPDVVKQYIETAALYPAQPAAADEPGLA